MVMGPFSGTFEEIRDDFDDAPACRHASWSVDSTYTVGVWQNRILLLLALYVVLPLRFAHGPPTATEKDEDKSPHCTILHRRTHLKLFAPDPASCTHAIA